MLIFSHEENRLLATWPDRVVPGDAVEFAIVYPRTNDADPGVFVQVMIVQSPQLDQRSLMLTVYDSSPEVRSPYSFALVLYERIGIDEIIEDMNLQPGCPPIKPQNACLLWFGSFAIQPLQQVFLRHGHALRLIFRRGIPIDLSQLLLMSDAQLRRTLHDSIWGELYRRPSFHVQPSEALHFQNHDHSLQEAPAQQVQGQVPVAHHDSRPQWIQDLQQIFDPHAFVENSDEGPVMYIMTWVVNGQNRERCDEGKAVRITSTCFDWRPDIVFQWRRILRRGRPVERHVVQPFPPRTPLQSYAAHVILSQDVHQDQRAVLITAKRTVNNDNGLRHVACVVLHTVTLRNIAFASGVSPDSIRELHSEGTLYQQAQRIDIQDDQKNVLIFGTDEPASSDGSEETMSNTLIPG